MPLAYSPASDDKLHMYSHEDRGNEVYLSPKHRIYDCPFFLYLDPLFVTLLNRAQFQISIGAMP